MNYDDAAIIGAVFIGLGAIFALIRNQPYPTIREHGDLIKAVEELRRDVGNLNERQIRQGEIIAEMRGEFKSMREDINRFQRRFHFFEPGGPKGGEEPD